MLLLTFIDSLHLLSTIISPTILYQLSISMDSTNYPFHGFHQLSISPTNSVKIRIPIMKNSPAKLGSLYPLLALVSLTLSILSLLYYTYLPIHLSSYPSTYPFSHLSYLPPPFLFILHLVPLFIDYPYSLITLTLSITLIHLLPFQLSSIIFLLSLIHI